MLYYDLFYGFMHAAADWSLLSEIASDPAVTVPLVGNGDVLCHWEAEKRLATDGVTALMIGRGALIKPWIFKVHNH
jgi:tRNA-dihydrouridine synthase